MDSKPLGNQNIEISNNESSLNLKNKKNLIIIIASLISILLLISIFTYIFYISGNPISNSQNNISNVSLENSQNNTTNTYSEKFTGKGLGISYDELITVSQEDINYSIKKSFKNFDKKELGVNSYEWSSEYTDGTNPLSTIKIQGTQTEIYKIELITFNQVVPGFGNITPVFIKPVLFNLDEKDKQLLYWYEDVFTYENIDYLTRPDANTIIGKLNGMQLSMQLLDKDTDQSRWKFEIIPDENANKYISYEQKISNQIVSQKESISFNVSSKKVVNNSLVIQGSISNLPIQSDRYNLNLETQTNKQFVKIVILMGKDKKLNFDTLYAPNSIRRISSTDTSINFELTTTCSGDLCTSSRYNYNLEASDFRYYGFKELLIKEGIF